LEPLKPGLNKLLNSSKSEISLRTRGSFNAIIVFFSWYRLVFERFEAISTSVQVVERDSLPEAIEPTCSAVP